MKSNLVLCLLVAGFLCGVSATRASDGFEYRFALNTPVWELGNATESRTNFEARLPEFEFLSYYRVSQKFHTAVFGDWKLGTSPVLERGRGRSGGDWSNTYRLDLELNPPKVSLGANGPTLGLRNRWELRWREGSGSERFDRIRQQISLSWDLADGFFESYGVANEVFYEIDKDLVTMNRFYPVMLKTGKLGDFSSSFYLMHQSGRSSAAAGWRGTVVLGAGISF